MLKSDAIALCDATGNKQVEYAYDAWGNCTTKTIVVNNFSNYNPIRYRGYYYDNGGRMRMGKCFVKDNGNDILTIRVGINIYRFSPIMLMFFVADIAALCALFKDAEIIGIVICTVIFLTLTLVEIFMEKFICLFRLPTGYLIFSNKKLIYKKGKKQFVYPIDEIKLVFYPFLKDFDFNIPTLAIHSNGDCIYVAITKKQYNQIVQYLNNR